MSGGVRRAIPRDADAIAHVHVTSWRAAYRGLVHDDYLDDLSERERAAGWRRGIEEGPGRALIAEEAGRVVGFVALGPIRDGAPDPGIGEIYAIYVLPERWGNGIGGDLFAGATEELRESGFSTGVLYVLQGNDRARRFYEKAGWTTDEIVTTEHIDCLDLPVVCYRTDLST